MLPKRNFQSTMRGYMFLGIFCLIMTVVMGLGQMSADKIKEDRMNNPQVEVSETSDIEESDTIEFLEMVEITPPKEKYFMISL